MGVRLLVLLSFKQQSGKLATGYFDFNDIIDGGESYFTKNPDWETTGITLRDWNNHNQIYYDKDKEQTEVRRYRAKKIHKTMTLNTYGEPVLPDPDILPVGERRRSYRQGLVRAFFSGHYGMHSMGFPLI